MLIGTKHTTPVTLNSALYVEALFNSYRQAMDIVIGIEVLSLTKEYITFRTLLAVQCPEIGGYESLELFKIITEVMVINTSTVPLAPPGTIDDILLGIVYEELASTKHEELLTDTALAADAAAELLYNIICMTAITDFELLLTGSPEIIIPIAWVCSEGSIMLHLGTT
ncbi:MAG: hypothetical protein Q9M11_03415 [Mariprofundaceae bacterium]|nr:hypothetical protein [Mariprofundaceae bacterium]